MNGPVSKMSLIKEFMMRHALVWTMPVSGWTCLSDAADVEVIYPIDRQRVRYYAAEKFRFYGRVQAGFLRGASGAGSLASS